MLNLWGIFISNCFTATAGNSSRPTENVNMFFIKPRYEGLMSWKEKQSLFLFVFVVHARNAQSIHMSSLELQQAFETVLKVIWKFSSCLHQRLNTVSIFYVILNTNNG